jgi:signal transduction histidine kinase
LATAAKGVSKPWLVILALAVVLVFAASYAWFSWQAERARQLRVMATMAEITGASMDAYLSALSNHLLYLGRDLQGANGDFNPANAQRLLRRFSDLNPGLRPINVTRIDGQILASSEADTAALPSLAKVPSFIEARRDLMAGAEVSISRPFMGVVTSGWLIAVRRAVKDESGRVLFTVGAGLPVDRSQEVWRGAPLPPGAGIAMIRSDGYLLSRYPPVPNVAPQTLYGQSGQGSFGKYMLEHPGEREGWIEARGAFTGKRTLYVFRRLEHFPAVVFLINPLENVWKAWIDSTQYFFILLGLFLVAGAVGVSYLYRRQSAWDNQRSRHIAELENANVELEAFTYTVSHDLRAPVRAIDGYAALLRLEHGDGLNEDGRQLIGKLRAAGQRMGDLVDALLEFSRYSRGTMQAEMVDMGALVQSAIAELGPVDAAMEISVGALPACLADATLIRQVWVNLLSNAIKYSKYRTAPKIEVGYAYGRYFVRDNGIGFDMKFSSQLFGVFNRLHADQGYEGLGIGLATVQRIVRRHGGEVSAFGGVGEGAVFSFSLPGRADNGL